MGNNSSSCAINEKGEELTEYDMTIYNMKKEKIYKGTIAICVVYAILALILFLAAYFNEKVRYVILNRFFPFTIVYIIGTLLIAIFLTYQVYNFKPIKINRNSNYDNLSCPDYWRLEQVPLDENNSTHRDLFDSSVNPGLFKYRCVMDPKVFNKGDIAKVNNNLRIANAGLADDKVLSSTSTNILNTSDKILYTNLMTNITDNTNPIGVKRAFLNTSNIDAKSLIKHNLIMNNYSISENNDKSLTANYRIESSRDLAAQSLGINKIKNDINIDNGSFAEFDPIANDNKTLKVDPTGLRVTNNASTPVNLTNIPMVCDRVYPLYLATKDVELSKNNSKLDQNVLRCAYSKACGVPWSDLNCDKYNMTS